MKSARTTIIAILFSLGAVLVIASANAHAYDFASICPPQPPPTWAGSAQTWSQFVNSCVANDGSARAGAGFDRRFWDNCIKTCGLANDAEGRIPPTPRQLKKQSANSEVLANPKWCSDVPASPAPPHYKADQWAYMRNQCMKKPGLDIGCFETCAAAKGLWQGAKAATPNATGTPNLSRHFGVEKVSAALRLSP